MGTRDEWDKDGSPAGGIGTITRPPGERGTDPAATPGERARPRPAAPPAAPRRPRRPHRPSRGRPGWGAPTREPTGAPPDDGGAWEGSGERKDSFTATREKAPGRERGKQSEWGKQKVPFFLLLCGLLGGALVCALVISTTLAEGSFQITRLQQANASLAKQRQLLQEQVAAAQSAQVIQARARQLGMLPAGELRFLNLKTGKIQTDAGTGAVRDIHVPGYTP